MTKKPNTQTYLDLPIETVYSDLTILSFGGGQDSTTILFKLVLDEKFKNKYIDPNGKFLVLMADTHTEHEETYQYLDDVIIPFCKKYNIEFIKIDNTMGYHLDGWKSLVHKWETGTRPTIGSVAYPKSCTHQLKLQPQFKYIEEWIPKHYTKVVPRKNKANFVQFAKYYGKIRWLVGLAEGEQKRVAKPGSVKEVWRKQSVEVIYPLIEHKLDRQSCQDYIKSIEKPIPLPSNCLYCPYSSNHMEILWLEKFYPDNFDKWVELEQKKLDAWNDTDKNLGVTGKLHKSGDRKGTAFTLIDLLKEAKEKYANISNEELWDYKMSHGHCVSSTY